MNAALWRRPLPGQVRPMTSSAIDILAVAAVFLLAGTVKGVIGLGLPTVAMGLLGLMMPPAGAAALIVLPSFMTNLWQCLGAENFGRLVRRLWPLLLAAFMATVAASGLIAGENAALATAGLGAALVTYAVLGLARLDLRVPRPAERLVGPVAGAATGLVTGATGVFVIPAVPYLAGLGLERDELVQALGLSFTVSTVALAVGLLWHGALPAAAAGASLAAVLPALAGMAAGARLRARIAPARFRRWLFIGLAVLGLQILWRAVAHS